MAELFLAASVPRQGSLNPDDSDDDGLMDGSAGVNRGVKLKRQPGKPTDVYSWFEITLQDIDVPSQTFQCSIEIHLFWQDYNLPNVIPDFETEEIKIHDDYVPIKMSEIFENKTDLNITTGPEFKYYPETGTVYMMLVVDCTFVERMELQRFPLDRQFMNMEFNAYVETPAIEGEGPWNWILEYPEWMPSELKQFDQKFAVRMISSITEYELLEPWVDFSTSQPLSIRLRVNRMPAYYFGNIIFPNFLIVAGCFSAFVIPRSDIADRLSVTVTLMLAAVAFRFIVSTMLPKVSYLTVMDYYLLLGFLALILMIAENAIAGIPSLDKFGDDIDLWCALIFGVMWVTTHIIALIALLRKECLRISWEEMDEIDSAEDEEAEFIFADKEYIKGNAESEGGKADWNKYKKFSVMERADLYAKTNNIKRSGTFHKKLKQEKNRKATENMEKIYEEALEKEEKQNTETNDNGENKEEENIEVYVPSKLNKVEPKKKAKTEDKMAASIELAEQTKPKEEEPEKQEKDEAPKEEKKTEPEPEVEPEPEPEPENKE